MKAGTDNCVCMKNRFEQTQSDRINTAHAPNAATVLLTQKILEAKENNDSKTPSIYIW